MDQPIDETRIRVDLFKEVQFSLCEDVIQLEQVKKALLFGGAKFLNYLSDNVTHLIADNSEHPSVSEALEIYEKPVVTSRWVWLSVKASTLLPTPGFSPFKNQLFSHIVACPSNISGADVQSLWAMITYYGGSFQLQLESNCTHLISTKPEGLKYEKAIETNEKIKIVTPDWVIDSVKNKSLCDEDLYHPRLLIFNNPSSTSNKIELSSDMTTTAANVSSGTAMTPSLPATSGSLVGPQFTLRTVTLPTTAMITTFTIAQPPQQTQTCSPTSVQGGRVRVFLPPQHQVRLMQMKQNQNRQICPTGVPQQQQVVNVQQMFQQRQPLLQQQTQQQQQQQQQQENAETNQQWTNSQPLVSQSQTYSQNAVTSQSIQVLSQSAPDFSKLRPTSGAIVPQQQMPAQQQPRQVYLAVQQQGIRQQPLVQVRQQHFISVQQQSQLQQQRPQSNIIIQQRGPNHTNVQSVRLQQAPQHLIQLQHRQPITLQSGQQTFVRAPQQIIIQQQNQQAIQRQLQIQHQMQNSQSFGGQSPQTGAIGLPQVQQRVTVPRMPQQFAQQNQLRGQQIRSPITATAQQIISTTIPTGQPRVFMKAQSQYSITQQQQFEQQQQQSPQTAQFIRAQTPSQPQLQFIRNPQWQPQSQDTSAPSQQQQLTSIRPQHILVATQPQPTQQQIMQWQQQQQDIQRRQLMQQQQQQQQNPQRFQLTSAIQPEKVRPTVSVVSVSSANTETQSAQLASAATTASTVRIAQTPIPPNIALSGNHSVAQQSVNPNPVSTANTTPNATIACPIVNPKTKTALANLLNNRLQSGNTGANKGDGGNSSSDGSPSNVSGSLSLSSSTSTLPNKTGFIGSPGVALTTGEMIQHLRQEDSHQNQNQMIQIRFYGFDPRLQIPSDQCLLGCFFFIYGYENLIDSNLIKLWKKKLIKYGAEIEDNYSPKCTHVLCENFQSPLIQQVIRDGKRCVSAYWLDDVLQLKKMLPPWKLFHLPIALNDSKPCKNHIITITNFEAEDRHRIKEMIIKTGAKYTGYMTQKNTIIICKRLEGEKYKKAVQWRLAIVNLFWLHDVLFGQNDALQLSTISKKYQQFDSKDPFKIDYSTVPHLMNPWRTPLQVSEDYIKTRIAEKNDKQLKSKDDIENKKETLESEENATEPQIKKIKLQETSSVIVKEELSSSSLALNVMPNLQTSNPDLARNIKVMFTAINSNRDNLKSIVQNLGGRVTNIYSECTHLITDRIARTVKFMCAFSSCKFIVTSDWILESAKQNRFANELQFILNDTEGEKYFNFNLQNSLEKRNPELFKGIVFYITHGCIPSPSLLKEMIESVGGNAVTTKRPTKRQLAKMRENNLKFMVITSDNDLHMCDVFFSRNVDVVNVEFVLSGILKQEVNIELYAFKQNLLKDD